MLEQFEDYFNVIIQKNVSTDNDIKRSILNIEELKRAFETKDIELAKSCMKVRHKNFYQNSLSL